MSDIGSETGALGLATRALSMTARAGLALSVLLLFAITVLVAGQVVVRNLFSLGLPWADELARWFGITLIYFTIPHLLLRGQHIAVSLLTDRVKSRVLPVISDFCVCGFAVLSLWAFQVFLDRAGKFTTPALAMPNLLFYLPALLGIVLLALIALLRIATLLRGAPA